MLQKFQNNTWKKNVANTPLLGQMTAVINCSIVQQGKSLANTVSVIFSLTHANSTAKSEHQINRGGGGSLCLISCTDGWAYRSDESADCEMLEVEGKARPSSGEDYPTLTPLSKTIVSANTQRLVSSH